MSMQPDPFDALDMTPEERAEVTARLDSWFGIDPATGAVGAPSMPPEDPQSPPPAIPEPAAQAPVPPSPAPPREYQLGAIAVPEQDADTVASIYTFLRNNPHRADEVKNLMQSPPPPPMWAAPPPPPTSTFQQPYTPPPAVSYTPAPGVPGVPPGLDLDDPTIRYMYDRQQALEARLAQADQATQQYTAQQNEQAARAAQQQQLAAQQELIKTNVESGIARFRAAHPDISDDDIGYATTEAARLNLVRGLGEVMPYDQAVARALELAHSARGSLAPPDPSAKTPANAKRQASLTSLSGGPAPSRTESAPALSSTQPRRNDGGPVLDDADREAALKMIQASGVGSLASQF